MKIHEYQGKQIFSQFGVNVLENRVAKTPAEAKAAFTDLGGPVAVVKAQIHAGGRGKGTFVEDGSQHGVQLVKSAEEAEKAAAAMLGNSLVTIQTGPEGKKVNQVIVEAGCDIDRELYLGIVLDRAVQMPVVMCSQEGGVEIEKVAHETPEKIFKEHFDPAQGIESYQVRTLCKKLGNYWQERFRGRQVYEGFVSTLCGHRLQLDGDQPVGRDQGRRIGGLGCEN